MFSNQTMRQLKEGKPHIAYIDGYWRVSPWRRDTAALYYEAHRWAVQRNRAEHEAGVAKGSYQVCDDPIKANRERNLDKQLRHALISNVGPACILGIIERNVL